MNQEMSKVNSYKNMARIVGVLFIIGTAAGVLSVGLIGTVEGTPDLGKFAANENMVLFGVLSIFIMAAACAGTAIWMYPVLKQYSESLALGAVCFRLIEAALMVIGAIIMLVLLSLSLEFVKAGAPDPSYFETLGMLVRAGYDWLFNVPMLLAWCTAALMYYYIFYRTKLIPRWITAWGIIGIILSMVASMSILFGILDTSMTVHTLMNFPIALQEMVMAVWLIAKGFDPAAIDSLSARAKSDKSAMAVSATKQKV
jgi:hypothetical protein